MGNALLSLLHGLVGTNDTTRFILMVGLNGAGKTSILNKLHLDEMVTTTSEMGLNIETLTYENICFSVFDVGGQLNPIAWKYAQNIQGLIFVVDSSDRERLLEVKDSINRVLNADEIRDPVLLIFANKQDLPTSMTVSQITEDLDCRNMMRGRPWFVQACSTTSGAGLYEGLGWLFGKLRP